ncbi:MAG: hypothetical protein RBR22_02500 [Desulfuromonas sp.]|nr:hypothetical protein [Desulfuromonas sp.]
MKTQMGLWIDHRKALIVTISGDETTFLEIPSEVEKQRRRTGDSPLKGSYEAQQVPADDSSQRAYTAELDKYYAEVISHLSKANAIFIMGPGIAKTELKSCLEKNRLGERILAIETADKMTDTEIMTKVRQKFA